MRMQPGIELNPNTIQKRPTISWFHFNFVKESLETKISCP